VVGVVEVEGPGPVFCLGFFLLSLWVLVSWERGVPGVTGVDERGWSGRVGLKGSAFLIGAKEILII